MSDTPDQKPQENPTPATAQDGAANPESMLAAGRRRWLAFWRENITSPAAAWRSFNTFTNELSRDYTFWLHFMAVRGGASVVVGASIFAVTYALTLPIALAATIIAGVTLAAGTATVALVAGGRFVVGRIRQAYDVLNHGAPAVSTASPHPPRSPRGIYKGLEWLSQTKAVQAVGRSRQWQMADHFVRRQKQWMLGGAAYGGAAMSAGVGGWYLATQIAVLPLIAVGSAISFATVAALGGVISGGVGIYFATKSLLRWSREEKKERVANAQQDFICDKTAPAAQTPKLAPSFGRALEAKDQPQKDETTAPADAAAPKQHQTPRKPAP